MTTRHSKLALAGCLSLVALAAFSSSDVRAEVPPAAGTAPRVQIVGPQVASVGTDACLTGPADQSKSLAAEKASVTIDQPNVTVLAGVSPPPAASACKAYVAELSVASTSKPGPGFTESFAVSATFDAGTTFTKHDCTAATPEAKIYKKSSGQVQFTYAGGGRLVATYHPEVPKTAGAAATPAACTYALAPSWVPVTGKVPAANGAVDTYRVVMSGLIVGSGIAKLARVAK